MDETKAKFRLNTKNIKVNINIEEIKVPSNTECTEFLPFSRAAVIIEIVGLSTSSVNALRRTLLDEIDGYCLDVGFVDVSNITHDDTCLAKLLGLQIANIPLKLGMSAVELESVFNVHIMNNTPNLLPFMSSDIKCSKNPSVRLFNPTFHLADIRPGMSLTIKNIKIIKGTGLHKAQFQSIAQPSMKELDIEEYPTESIMHGEMSGFSGRKLSTLVVDSCHHQISFKMRSFNTLNKAESIESIHNIIKEACRKLIENFRALRKEYTIEKDKKLIFTVDSLTIAPTLVKAIYDITLNKIRYINAQHNSSSNKVTTITIDDDDPVRLLFEAIEYLTNIYSAVYDRVHNSK